MSLPLTLLRHEGRVYVDVDDLMTWLIYAERAARDQGLRGEVQAFSEVQRVLLAGAKAEP